MGQRLSPLVNIVDFGDLNIVDFGDLNIGDLNIGDRRYRPVRPVFSPLSIFFFLNINKIEERVRQVRQVRRLAK